VWALAPVVLVGGAAVAGLASAAASLPVGWAPPGEGVFVAVGLTIAAQVAERMVTWQPIGAHRSWFRASVVLEKVHWYRTLLNILPTKAIVLLCWL
jgi:hypothetical protein